MSDTLVDSSVWIDFFRGDRHAVLRVDPLIAENRVALTGLVSAGVLSGARDRATFERLKLPLRALGAIADPADVCGSVAETRFTLARGGFQAAIADLVIAVTAAHAAHRLLTRDRDFERIARALSRDVEVF